MALPTDYVERVYAGVLGKLIGVYLGRPIEGMTYERITQEFGEINYYIHKQRGVPLIVTDDDISGTFTFARAMSDYGNKRTLTAQQIGQTWLNYCIEERAILWWGGVGNSTEHTAYIRLKNGIPAPRSGSTTVNGKTVAEQIGAQIFIDGWAMMAPNDPDLASDLAVKAASVSHDGEAIYGAQVVAVMESLAFGESNIGNLLDAAVRYIPKDSTIYHLIADLREWRAAEPDWRQARARVAERYGYDKYPGNCHIVPNHALIILGLLYGDDDFQKSLLITNTAGWDTDCNSGNVGCLMGIKNGLAGIESGPDWRMPIADRLYLSSAEGGFFITDAVNEAYRLVNVGRALVGDPPVKPKGDARFHFELPGSVQGFAVKDDVDNDYSVIIANVAGHSARGRRSLAIHYRTPEPAREARVATPTFIPPDALAMSEYMMAASPTLYCGQTAEARVEVDSMDTSPVKVQLYVSVYRDIDTSEPLSSPAIILEPGESHEFVWTIPDTGGDPIREIGVRFHSLVPGSGTIYLDTLTWSGSPTVTFTKPKHGGSLWRSAWVNGVDYYFGGGRDVSFRLVQNAGRGLLIQGTREWDDYVATATLKTETARAAGIAIRVQGMRRYYALLLDATGKVRLVRALDGETVLAEADYNWTWTQTYTLRLEGRGNHLRGWINGKLVADVEDKDAAFEGGGVAYVIEEGTLLSEAMAVESI